MHIPLKKITALFASIVLMFICSIIANGQNIISLRKINSSKNVENTWVEKLNTNITSSTFFISIKEEVKPHLHVKHDEQVLVVSGKGRFYIKEEVFTIHKGDLIFIPRNTPHAVKVTSRKPLNVVSTQCPEFDGSDRVPTEILNY